MDASDAGRVIGGRYECVELIGRGGMGEVWRARDTLLQRDVAVKRLAYGDGAGDEATVGRSMREARLAARLNHPNAVGIYDVVVDDGTAKLTDFGIARDEGDSGLTSTGTFIGTPNFLAPEIALGGNHGPASDVWALGAMLYSAVEGEPPFSAGGNALAILNRIATTDPPAPRHAGPLAGIIAAAMRRDPAGRPPAATIVFQLDELVDRARDRPGIVLRPEHQAAPPSPVIHTPPPQQTTPQPRTPVPLTGPYTPPPVTAPPPAFAPGGDFGPPTRYNPPGPPSQPARRSR